LPYLRWPSSGSACNCGGFVARKLPSARNDPIGLVPANATSGGKKLHAERLSLLNGSHQNSAFSSRQYSHSRSLGAKRESATASDMAPPPTCLRLMRPGVP
jgi:hypothetical protein